MQDKTREEIQVVGLSDVVIVNDICSDEIIIETEVCDDLLICDEAEE